MTDPNRPPSNPIPPAPEEELVPADDAIIGVAFRWSLAAIAVVAAAVLVTVLWLGGEDEAPAVVLPKDPGEIADLEAGAAAMPEIPFTDVTDSAGLEFVHFSGAIGQKLLPETMGSGAAFLDFDGDGDQDLLLANGRSWPWDRHQGPEPTPVLYRNDGTGRFEDVTAGSGLDVPIYGTGVVCGDFDGDGRTDVFLAAVGTNRLLRNAGAGRFEDVTAAAGVAGGDAQWSTSGAFFDADGDGDLDLFVCNYVQWSREIDLEVNYTLNGVDRAYGPPTNFRGDHPALYRNEGGGRFTDVSGQSGVQVANPVTGAPISKALAVTPVDVDADGDLDLLVANDTTQNLLLRNRGDGTFDEEGATAGIAYDGHGQSTGAMGVDAAHFRNDDDLAVAVGNFANEMTSFYVRQGRSAVFSDDAVVEGVGSPTRIALSFGLFFFDADLDGWLDLLQTNGHLEEAINQLQPSQHYRQPAQLFWNCGPEARSTYVVMPEESIGDLARPMVGRGAAFADVDGDGDLDVLVTQVAEAPRLLRNDQDLGHHWLRVRLRGRAPNPEAIGARVELEADGQVQRRQVMPSRSYLCQVELPVTFGLGHATAVDALRVTWPDGTVQRVAVEGVDREIVVEQSGALEATGRRSDAAKKTAAARG